MAPFSPGSFTRRTPPFPPTAMLRCRAPSLAKCSIVTEPSIFITTLLSTNPKTCLRSRSSLGPNCSLRRLNLHTASAPGRQKQNRANYCPAFGSEKNSPRLVPHLLPFLKKIPFCQRGQGGGASRPVLGPPVRRGRGLGEVGTAVLTLDFAL